jgi:hypothetical protein
MNKLEIPKANTTKQSTVRFCSSKKNKIKPSNKFVKQAHSSKGSTRIIQNKLSHSIGSFQKSGKKSSIKNNSILSEEAQELVSKYVGRYPPNSTSLSSEDRLLLTRKALFKANNESGSFDSLECSNKNGSNLRPYSNNNGRLTSNATVPCYINLIDEEGERSMENLFNPITKVSIRSCSKDSRKSNKSKKSAKSKSRSKSKKRNSRIKFPLKEVSN